MFWTSVIAKAVVASAFALVAKLACRRGNRPQLEYLAWQGVLWILILPPIVSFPILSSQLANRADHHLNPPRVPHSGPPEDMGRPISQLRDSESVAASPWVGTQRNSARNRFGGKETVVPASPMSDRDKNQGRSSITIPTFAGISGIWIPGVGTCLLFLWIVVGVGLLLRQFLRLRNFGHLLPMAEAAPPEVDQVCRKIAQEMNLRSCPDILTANGKFSPFLWHPFWGAAQIVLPLPLVQSLTDDSLETILRHELIHFCRRDSFRRYLELLVTAIWWWLPTTWFAIRRLRELEEICTDAEVIRSSPKLSKAYAIALLDTEEYLSSAPRESCQLVPTFTEQNLLKTRIEMIIKNESRLAPLASTRFLSVFVGLLVIPLGLVTAGTIQEQSNAAASTSTEQQTAESNGDSIIPTNATSEVQGSYAIAGSGDTFFNISTNSDTIKVSISANGVSKKAVLKRKSPKDVVPAEWDLTQYENSAADQASDDLGWLFRSMGVADTIVLEGKTYTSPDLEKLPGLLEQAADGDIDHLFASVQELISTDARGQVLANIAAREDLKVDQQAGLIDLLNFSDVKARVSFGDQWASKVDTVNALSDREDLSDESKKSLERMQRSDPAFRVRQSEMNRERHLAKMKEHRLRMVEHEARMKEHDAKLKEHEARIKEHLRKSTEERSRNGGELDNVQASEAESHRLAIKRENLALNLENLKLQRQSAMLRRQAVALQRQSAGEVQSGEVQVGEVQSGEVQSGKVQVGEVQSGEVQSGKVQVGEVQSGEVQVGEVQVGKVQSGEVQSGENAIKMP